ncbi:MAG: FtsW/RodA/SpoVE family cell cycle protein [Patescibacteria group bacterium]|nr:FtsW/RodA/SpoVE family cell cycle protein [Patescibacteria group bacterium]
MQKNKIDYTILGIVSSIIIFGLLILASATSVVEKISFFEQIYLGIIPGVFLAFVFLKTPLHIIKKVAPFLFLINLALIIIILISGLSYAAGGSTRWLSIGPLSFQPSEFLKLTFILYIASWLSSKDFKKDKKRMKNILFPFIVLCIALGLIFYNQPDLSTFLVIISIGIILYFTAGAPFSHIFSTISAGGLIALFFLWRFPYALNRIVGAMSPEVGLSDVNYQARQSLITIGSGGLSGVGLGMSEQKFGNLPEQATDFIFSILAEETGFLGAFLIVLLFLGFLFRAIFLAMKTDDKFSRFILIGVGSWIFIQSSVNIGVAVNIFPVTGIPLPFISYGKSHLVAELAAIGLMLNASQYVKKEKRKTN